MKKPNRHGVGVLPQEPGEPVDFEALVQAGILRRKSKLSFEVLDMDRLPDHARLQAQGARIEHGKPPILTLGRPNKTPRQK